MLPLIDSTGYPGGFLSFRNLGVVSFSGGPVTLVSLASRPRFGLSVVVVLLRVDVLSGEGSVVVRPPIPLVVSAVW